MSHDDDKLLDDFLDGKSRISDIFDKTKVEQPSADLDEAILAQSIDAVTMPSDQHTLQKSSGKSANDSLWSKWKAPLALAATLMLGVNLAVNLKDFNRGPDFTDTVVFEKQGTANKKGAASSPQPTKSERDDTHHDGNSLIVMESATSAPAAEAIAMSKDLTETVQELRTATHPLDAQINTADQSGSIDMGTGVQLEDTTQDQTSAPIRNARVINSDKVELPEVREMETPESDQIALKARRATALPSEPELSDSSIDSNPSLTPTPKSNADLSTVIDPAPASDFAPGPPVDASSSVTPRSAPRREQAIRDGQAATPATADLAIASTQNMNEDKDDWAEAPPVQPVQSQGLQRVSKTAAEPLDLGSKNSKSSTPVASAGNVDAELQLENEFKSKSAVDEHIDAIQRATKDEQTISAITNIDETIDETIDEELGEARNERQLSSQSDLQDEVNRNKGDSAETQSLTTNRPRSANLAAPKELRVTSELEEQTPTLSETTTAEIFGSASARQNRAPTAGMAQSFVAHDEVVSAYTCDFQTLGVTDASIKVARDEALILFNPPYDWRSWLSYMNNLKTTESYVEACSHLAAFTEIYKDTVPLTAFPLKLPTTDSQQ